MLKRTNYIIILIRAKKNCSIRISCMEKSTNRILNERTESNGAKENCVTLERGCMSSLHMTGEIEESQSSLQIK